MATKGNIKWKPKSKAQGISGVTIEGHLSAEHWEDFGRALQDLGKEHGLKIKPIRSAKKKAQKKKPAKKAVKK